MSENKIKLASAALALIIAVVLLVTGTFAWFTLSTSSEMHGLQVHMDFTGEEWPFEFSLTGDPDQYVKELPVLTYFSDDNLENAKTMLRPITSGDGEHWYLPNYAANGGVLDFRLADLDVVGSNLTSPGGVRSDEGNYLVYFDMWVRTQDKDSTYQLMLSNPLPTSQIMDEEVSFGTYLVSVPEVSAGALTLTTEGEDASCCARLGFLVYGQGKNGGNKFVIYEPNADKRSRAFLDALEQVAETKDLVYISTDNSGSGNPLESYAGSASEGAIQTDIVLPVPDDSGSGIKMIGEGDPGFPDIIRQYKSSWNETSIAAIDRSDLLNSRYIETMGPFVSEEDIPIATVDISAPVKIRVFLWLEGQDIDCWNIIRKGSILANMEFKGVEVAQ